MTKHRTSVKSFKTATNPGSNGTHGATRGPGPLGYDKNRGQERPYLVRDPSLAGRLLSAGVPLIPGLTPALCAALGYWLFAPCPRLSGMRTLLLAETVPAGVEEPMLSLDGYLDPDLVDEQTLDAREPADGDDRFTIYARPDLPRPTDEKGFDPALGRVLVALRAVWSLYVHDRWDLLTTVVPDSVDPLFEAFVAGPVETLDQLPVEESEPFVWQGRICVFRLAGEHSAMTRAVCLRRDLDVFAQRLGWWRDEPTKCARDPSDAGLLWLARESPYALDAAIRLLDRYWDKTHPDGEQRRRPWHP